MMPELKTYVDMKQQFELQAFIRTAEEWEISQPEGTSWFKKTGLQGTPPYRQSQTGIRYYNTDRYYSKVYQEQGQLGPDSPNGHVLIKVHA